MTSQHCNHSEDRFCFLFFGTDCSSTSSTFSLEKVKCNGKQHPAAAAVAAAVANSRTAAHSIGSVGVDSASTLERPLIWFATEMVLPLSFAPERSSAAVRSEVEPLAVLHFRNTFVSASHASFRVNYLAESVAVALFDFR